MSSHGSGYDSDMGELRNNVCGNDLLTQNLIILCTELLICMNKLGRVERRLFK
jgi:hypothetical protein